MPVVDATARARYIPRSSRLSDRAAQLRTRVRDFLRREMTDARVEPQIDGWLTGWDAEFSARLGAAGFIGVTLPTEYGGSGGSYLDRIVVTEELLAAGAPVAAHWFADRQIAPALVRIGSDAQRAEFLPRIVRGQCHFAIGLSEPESGSDLASVRTRAERTDGGWCITGEKIWTSGAHRAHAMTVLARTDLAAASRHEGLSQFIVRLPDPRLQITPIRHMNGEHHFNSVHCDEVFVPDGMVLGTIGQGWQQVVDELAFERSGPERYLSTFPLFRALVERIRGRERDRLVEFRLGELIVSYWSLRQICIALASAMDAGDLLPTTAAMVKDLSTQFESTVLTVARECGVIPSPLSGDLLERLAAQAVVKAPGFTLRGGTTEVLRSMVARSIGLR